MKMLVSKINFCLFLPKSKNIGELGGDRPINTAYFYLAEGKNEINLFLKGFQEFLNYSRRNGHV